MANDGYEIINGRLIVGNIITSDSNIEVSRITLPDNVDIRINTLCLIQNQSDANDGYSYWLESLISRETGSAIDMDGYGRMYNASGIETEMLVDVATDGYDVVYSVVQSGTDSFRVVTYTTIYQIENSELAYPMGITITDPDDPWVTDMEFAASGTIFSGEHVVSFSGSLDGGTAQSFTQTGDTWAGDGSAGSSAGYFDLEVSVTYDNAEVRTATVSVQIIAPD